MPSTTTIPVGRPEQAAVTTPMPKRNALSLQGERFLSWKTVLVRSLGRELHALHIQQQERAFMATSHGLNYRSVSRETAMVH